MLAFVRAHIHSDDSWAIFFIIISLFTIICELNATRYEQQKLKKKLVKYNKSILGRWAVGFDGFCYF